MATKHDNLTNNKNKNYKHMKKLWWPQTYSQSQIYLQRQDDQEILLHTPSDVNTMKSFWDYMKRQDTDCFKVSGWNQNIDWSLFCQLKLTENFTLLSNASTTALALYMALTVKINDSVN